jgi:hypothetical protein
LSLGSRRAAAWPGAGCLRDDRPRPCTARPGAEQHDGARPLCVAPSLSDRPSPLTGGSSGSSTPPALACRTPVPFSGRHRRCWGAGLLFLVVRRADPPQSRGCHRLSGDNPAVNETLVIASATGLSLVAARRREVRRLATRTVDASAPDPPAASLGRRARRRSDRHRSVTRHRSVVESVTERRARFGGPPIFPACSGRVRQRSNCGRQCNLGNRLLARWKFGDTACPPRGTCVQHNVGDENYGQLGNLAKFVAGPTAVPSGRRDSQVVSNALGTASLEGFGPGTSRVRDAGTVGTTRQEK